MFHFVLFCIGYVTATLAWYANHRFIFHGPLGKLPILSKFSKMHKLHHAHAYDEHRNSFIMIPWWGHILLLIGSAPLAFVGLSCWLGAFCFTIHYGIKHSAMHNKLSNSLSFSHHEIHHKVAPLHNFSGIHPIVDSIFKARYDAK